MLKLGIKFLFFVVLVVLICYGTLFLNPKYKRHYLSSIKNKLEKLEKVKVKKIVIIGGSNACFGIDSELIENTLGIPVVNTALHAALGPNFWINYVESNLNEGDIVIMSPEYGMLSKQGWNGLKSNTVATTLSYTPSKLKILAKDYGLLKRYTLNFFSTIKLYWKNHPIKSEKNHNTYDIRSFKEDNIKGDYIKSKSLFKKKFEKKALNFDKEFTSWFELKQKKLMFDEKKVKLFITLPSALEEAFDTEKAKNFIESYSNLSEVSILNENTDYFFERKYLYDTEYHLNKQGRMIRTKRLINDIGEEIFKDQKKNNAERKSIFITKANNEEVPLQKLKMSYKINTKYFREDSIGISPKTLDKLGFLKYKTEVKDYNGYLFKIVVKASTEVLNKLKFRSSKSYDFDYVEDNKNGTFTFCKVLSNTIYISDDKKGTSFSSVGIGFEKGSLSLTDSFTILKVNLLKMDIDCEETALTNIDDKFKIEHFNKPIYFSLKNLTEKEYKVNDILNINSSQELIEDTKYQIKVKSGNILLIDFYNGDLVHKEKCPSIIKFNNSKDYGLDINY